MRKHKFKVVGHTPSGGIAGGDDLYECEGCGFQVDATELKKYKNDYCSGKKMEFPQLF